MINVSTEGKSLPEYDTFIDNCIMALFPEDAQYDINICFKKYVDKDGSHAGFCMGDTDDCAIDIATHWIFEEGEEVAYQPHEIAGSIAHELVHAKQFYRNQINMVDHVWKHNHETINCEKLDYAETPWEVEAYTYEQILTDLLWENV